MGDGLLNQRSEWSGRCLQLVADKQAQEEQWCGRSWWVLLLLLLLLLLCSSSARPHGGLQLLTWEV
jgi:hypothetical protein